MATFHFSLCCYFHSLILGEYGIIPWCDRCVYDKRTKEVEWKTKYFSKISFDRYRWWLRANQRIPANSKLNFIDNSFRMHEFDEFDTRLCFGAATCCDIIFGPHNGRDRSSLLLSYVARYPLLCVTGNIRFGIEFDEWIGRFTGVICMQYPHVYHRRWIGTWSRPKST